MTRRLARLPVAIAALVLVLTGAIGACVEAAHARPLVICEPNCLVVESAYVGDRYAERVREPILLASLERTFAPAQLAAAVPLDAGAADGIGTSPSAPAAAATLPDPDSDLGGFAAALLAAARAGQWRLLAAGMLMLVVWLARRYGAKAVPWFATDRGGVLLVLLLGILGGAATALAAGKMPSAAGVIDALSIALTAAGGWAALRKLLGSKAAQ